MKGFIMAAGFMIAGLGIWMGMMALDVSRREEGEIRQISLETEQFIQKIAKLKELPQRPAVPLSQAYADVVSDAYMLSRLHHLVCSVNVEGVKGADVLDNAVSAGFEGVKEIRMEIVFSGLKRQGTLLSLLDALASVTAEAPVMLRRVQYEKDVVSVQLSVMGV